MNIKSQPAVNLYGSLSLNRQLALTLSLGFCGFSSVGSISLSMFQLGHLPFFFSIWVVPAILVISIASLAYPTLGKLCLQGWFSGLVAVLLYDVSRVPFILAGWDDFIPKIGVWLLQNESAHPLLGYLYRYAGNGGGIGISFVLLYMLCFKSKNIVYMGIAFGLAVFSCLMLTLVFSPLGQDEMFRITVLTFTGSLIGHIIYGWVLGLMLRRFPLQIKTTSLNDNLILKGSV